MEQSPFNSWFVDADAFGEFFDGAFRAIQHNPRVMFGLSLLVSVVLGLLQAAVFAPALAALDGSAIVEEAVEAQALGALLGGSVLTALVSALATIVLNGLLVVSVSQSILGRRVSVRSVWDRARPQLLRLIGLTIVTSALQFAMVAAVVVGAVAFFGAALVNADRGGSPEGMIVAAIRAQGALTREQIRASSSASAAGLKASQSKAASAKQPPRRSSTASGSSHFRDRRNRGLALSRSTTRRSHVRRTPGAKPPCPSPGPRPDQRLLVRGARSRPVCEEPLHFVAGSLGFAL